MQNHPNPFHHSNKSLLSRAREDHLTCSICLCKNGVAIVDPELDEPWVLTLKCTNDISHPNWSTCLFCGYRCRARYKDVRSLKNHKSLHKRKGGPRSNSLRVSEDQTLEWDTHEQHYESNNNGHILFSENIPSKVKMNFSNDPSNAFFLHEYTNNTGWKSIVAKSFLGHEVPPTLVSDEDAILGQHFVRLVMLMTREQRGIFGSFLSCYTKKLLSQDSYQHNVDFSLMASPAKIRSTVFKGATAVLQNLPIPPVTLVSDYSYASLNEIVADFMAHGYYYEVRVHWTL